MREPGDYWIKIHDKWVIAHYYNTKFPVWYYNGAPISYHDKNLQEIDERQLRITAEEILFKITCYGQREITQERALQAMKEYAETLIVYPRNPVNWIKKLLNKFKKVLLEQKNRSKSLKKILK